MKPTFLRKEILRVKHGTRNIHIYACTGENCIKELRYRTDALKAATFKCRSCNNTGVVSKNRLNLVGQKFGTLTVVKYGRYIPAFHNTVWEVSCECGVTKEISAGNLKRRQNPTCGNWKIHKIVARYENRRRKAISKKDHVCSGCRIRKDRSEFFSRKDGLIPSLCKKCAYAKSRQYVKAHPEAKKEWSLKHFYKKNYGEWSDVKRLAVKLNKELRNEKE